MAEDPREIEALERELESLGPLMSRQEIALSEEPNPQFSRTLRDRLTGAAGPAPRVREPAPSLWDRFKRHRLIGGGLSLAGAAVTAVLIVVVLGRSGHAPSGTQTVAFPLPAPGRRTIEQNYPQLGQYGGGGLPDPWVSGLELPTGSAFTGTIHLRTAPGALPPGPRFVPAYELESPAAEAAHLGSLAARIGIRGPVLSTTQQGVRWKYINAGTTGRVTHSLAISPQTGEVIFHDTRFPGTPVAPGQRPIPTQITAARAWLTRLGWPGATMTLHQPSSPLEADLSWVVHLDWPGVSHPVTADASIIVASSGHIIEALVYPPVARHENVAARTAGDAFAEITSGRVRIGVELPPGTRPVPAFAAGRGAVRSTSLTYLLTPGTRERLYLVPAYRFSGTIKVQGFPGTRRWYAFVPAAEPKP